MTKILHIVATAGLVTAISMPVHAQSTTSGNLNVTTSVSATCQTPSPGGTLNAPFDPALAIDNQVDGSPVTVTVTCSGGASITDVTFDNGQHVDEGALTGRVLKGDDGTACFAYTLKVSDGSITGPAPLNDGSTSSGSWDWTGQTSFDVIAQLTDGAIEDNGNVACNDATAASADMPGDDYRDTLTMTVEFQ